MNENDTKQWLEAFKAEHGFYPHEDPDLIGKGMNEQDAMQEHLRAKTWGEEYFAATGERPTKDVYRSEQPRRYSDGGDLISGFGGFTPERVEKMQNERPSRQGPPSANPATFRRNPRFEIMKPIKKNKPTWSR